MQHESRFRSPWLLFGLLALVLASCGGASAPREAASTKASSPRASGAPMPPEAAVSVTPAPPPAPAPPSIARAALRLDRTVAAGKWPEGIAVVGDFAWVAESGSRRLLRIPLDGEAPVSNLTVGRLPVELELGPNGKLYALAHTDKTLWEIDPATSKSRIVATLPDCPEAMAIDADAAWVLQTSRCSSVESSVVRVDLATGKQRSSSPTGADASAIAVAGGHAWVGRRDGALRAVDSTTLQLMREVGGPGAKVPGAHLASGPSGVFASSEMQIWRIDTAKAEQSHAVTLGEPIAALALDGVDLLAIGRQGTIWVLDPATLAVRRELASPVRDVPPHAIARHGERFLVTDHGPGGQHGRVLVLTTGPATP